ncbi:MAG: InlB B-repeat-containing protein, partial [Opitutaceae bacterium]
YKNGAYFSAGWMGTQGNTTDTGVQTVNYLATYSCSAPSSNGSNSRQVQITPPLPSGQVTGPTSGTVGTNNAYSLVNVSNANDWQWEMDLPDGGAFEWQGGYGTANPHNWGFGSGAGTYKFRAHLRGPSGNAYTNEITVTAYYQLSTSVSPGGAGSVSGGGLYQANATANLSATANSGYVFTGWSGDASGSSNPTTVVMNGNKSVTANFAPVVNSPVITSSGTASGAVGVAFNYQIAATNNPTSYGASGLPPGLSVNTGTGLISGTPTTASTYNATISATNSGGTGNAAVTIVIGGPIGGQNDAANQNQLNIHLPSSP